MGSDRRLSHQSTKMSTSELREKHQRELENLTLLAQPFKTWKFFFLGVFQYIKRSISYLLSKGGWLLLSSTLIAVFGILLLSIEEPHEKHLEEILKYFEFCLWWVVLGVASSIGLGSGLHTFVLYLGPHIAFYTIKAVQCGRVDLKIAPYDTIQWNRGPSWLEKDCSEFGPSMFESSRVPLGIILPKVQLEAILWGVGTAIGELPPYFISRAASISGSTIDAMGELDTATENNGLISTNLNKMKRWLLSHSQHMNFFTILVLASVPNPLFDLAGIMCGQFGISFGKFFTATLIGKAIVKTHIQTIFIISICNNQLLDWIENELIWILSHVPGFSLGSYSLSEKINSMKEKYMKAPSHGIPDKVKKWEFSFTSIWNTVVWLMIMNFLVSIVTATAQRYLKKQQEKEIAVLLNNPSQLEHEQEHVSQ